MLIRSETVYIQYSNARVAVRRYVHLREYHVRTFPIITHMRDK